MIRFALTALLLLLTAPAWAQSETYFTVDPDSGQTIVYGSTSATTADFGAYNSAVLLLCTTACFVSFATPPDATVATQQVYLPAGVSNYFTNPSHGIAVTRIGSTDGSLYITEVTR